MESMQWLASTAELKAYIWLFWYSNNAVMLLFFLPSNGAGGVKTSIFWGLNIGGSLAICEFLPDLDTIMVDH